MDKWDYFCCDVAQKLNNFGQHIVSLFVHYKSKNLTKKLNISYGEHKFQRYDLIYKDTKEKKPLFIYIHGGGFICGAIALRRPFCYKIANEQNYFVANIDYRVAPQAHMHEQMQDVFDAISEVLDQADKCNFDTSKVVIGGESAGAYFANYIATITSHKNLYNELNINFKYKDNFTVKSTLLINGVYEMQLIKDSKQPNVKSFVKGFCNLTKKEYENLQNIDATYFNSTTFIDSSYPPSVIHKGDKDVFGLSTERIIDLFDNKKVEYFLITATGFSGNHGFTILPVNKESDRCFNLSFEKINEYINR